MHTDLGLVGNAPVEGTRRSRAYPRLASAVVAMCVLGGAAGLVITLAGQVLRPRVEPIASAADVPPPPHFGPRRDITCPADAVDIPPGADIQRAIDSRRGATTFCLKAGVHQITRAISPKSGNAFVGEYGAILDGSGWTTTDSTQGAFRAHNQDIDDVTIRNLVIRKMPQRGIHAFSWASDRWTIEYNEIAENHVGVLVPNATVVRNNYVHHNVANASSSVAAERGGGYIVYQSADVRFESNEFAYNGSEQKVSRSRGVTFRDNFVHHNIENGIWYDGDNVGSLIEGNTVEDNAGFGIFYEISGRGVISGNTVRRSGDAGVFISTSKDAEIANNTLEDNFRGIMYFVTCTAIGGGDIGWDLANDVAHDNIVRVGNTRGSFASGLSHTADCTPAQFAPYLNSRGLEFADNHYFVPSQTVKYWFWGPGRFKSFTEWQGLGRDFRGSVAPY